MVRNERWKQLAICAVLVLGIIAVCVIFRLIPHPKPSVSFKTIQTKGPLTLLNLGLIAAAPGHSKSETYLLVYLHGLGGTYLEPFKLPCKRPYALVAKEGFPSISFASCDYGTPGVWCRSADMNDITCEINRLTKLVSFDKIILAGSSMGGSAALTYAAKAPEQIRRKIAGIIAIYPAGDFVELYQTTREPVITLALERAFGGNPAFSAPLYEDSSFLPHLNDLPANAKVYVMSALKDTVLPTALQSQLVNRLQSKNVEVRLETFPCTHMQPPPAESFERALRFISDSNSGRNQYF